jgi:hypothetical protein
MGGLAESMQLAREFETPQAFIEWIKKNWTVTDEFDELEVRQYAYDDRIGWNTYVVCVRGKGIGFLNGPLVREPGKSLTTPSEASRCLTCGSHEKSERRIIGDLTYFEKCRDSWHDSSNGDGYHNA